MKEKVHKEIMLSPEFVHKHPLLALVCVHACMSVCASDYSGG